MPGLKMISSETAYSYYIIGATNHCLPSATLLQCPANMESIPDLLFILLNSKPIIESMFRAALIKAFKEMNLIFSHLNAQSFRIRAATSATVIF